MGILKYFTKMWGVKMHYIYHNGDEVYIAEVVFLCDKYRGELKVQETEVLEPRFFDLDKPLDNISPINEEVIRRLAKELAEEKGVERNV